MTPQKQTILSDKSNGIYGNCLVTALASYMDVLANECPQFQLFFDVKQPCEGFYDIIVTEWIKTMGYTRRFLFEYPYKLEEYADYYLASGKSQRGNYHLVVYKNGELAHDPHPDNSGIQPDEYWILEKIKDHWRWNDSHSPAERSVATK